MSTQDNEHIIGKAYPGICYTKSIFIVFGWIFLYIVVFHFCVIIVLVVLPLSENDCCLAQQLCQLNYNINKFLFDETITSALYSPLLDICTYYAIIMSFSNKHQFKSIWCGRLDH